LKFKLLRTPSGLPTHLAIGARLRELRRKKKLSQRQIEQATGLLKCYISRIENGRTVPSLETLERFAAALDVPLHELFYDLGQSPARTPGIREALEHMIQRQGKAGSEARFLLTLTSLCAQMTDFDRQVLLGLARRMAERE
jgi:transcriptional regulator with XRE-family HTH domain